MSEKELFFHMGFPKAGSTYLQRALFPQLKGIKYFKKSYFKRYPELIEQTDYNKYLFSTETYKGLEERTKAIVERYPQAKIILVLRRHDKWIASRYKYYIRKNGSMTFREYFDIHHNNGLWKIEDLYFGKKLEAINAHLNHPPLVLFIEEIKANPETFLEKIKTYFGVDLEQNAISTQTIKKNFTEKQIFFLRKFNERLPYNKLNTNIKLLRRTHYKLRQGIMHLVALAPYLVPNFKYDGLIDPKDLEAIREHYQEDWQYCHEFAEQAYGSTYQ